MTTGIPSSCSTIIILVIPLLLACSSEMRSLLLALKFLVHSASSVKILSQHDAIEFVQN
jgi:hypothetical protein